VLLNLSFNLGMAVFMFAHAYGYIRSCLWLCSLVSKNPQFYMMQLAGHITDLAAGR
jgi:hypothetical protein